MNDLTYFVADSNASASAVKDDVGSSMYVPPIASILQIQLMPFMSFHIIVFSWPGGEHCELWIPILRLRTLFIGRINVCKVKAHITEGEVESGAIHRDLAADSSVG